MHTTPRSKRRVAAGAASVVAAVLVLSGCYRVDMAVTIHSNETIDGSAIIAIDKSVLSMAGGTIDDVIPDDALDDSGSVEPWTEGDLVGKKFTFEKTPISEFGDDDMKVTHEGDTFVMDGTLDMSSDEGDDATASGGTVKVSFTFPGEIVEANGDIDEETNTVTWSPTDLSVPLEMHAVGKDGAAAGGVAPWLYAVGAAALLLVAGAIALVVARSRRKPAPAGPEATDAAPAGETVLTPTPDVPDAQQS